MYLAILYLPLMGAFLAGFFGRFLGIKGSQFITILNVGLVFCFSVCIFFEVAIRGSLCYLTLFNWFNVGLLHVNWGFIFDPLTATMLVVVSGVSFLVHIYAVEYMRGDPFTVRFMAYLSLFTWFMLILVTADNLIQLFVGWEGVGLVSYLLINFWFTIQEANKSALKAMVVNRIGDLGIALAIALIYFVFKTVNFNVFLPIVHLFADQSFIWFNFSVNAIELIAILVFIGAVGKSAQLGLHVWLPDAMAGPTPVSALIHAATMVTAGVFVLIRMSPLLEYSQFALMVIAFVGVSTSFFAATVGLFQNDLKKIIAYSTCSQLGYMVFICGLSNYSLSIFHLTNHAFFKALLFLSAGAIIHAMSDEQDIRKMGGLIQLLPFSYVMLFIGSLALMGTPFLAGFYSKDFILEVTYTSYFINGGFIYWVGTLSALFTAFYSFRLIFFTFYTKTNAYRSVMKNVHEVPFLLGFPLGILALNSIFFGFLFKDFFIGLGSDSWINSIFMYKKNLLILESEFLPVFIKNIPFFFTLCGVSCVFLINVFYYNCILTYFKTKGYGYNFFLYLISFISYKWYFDVLYNKYVVGFFFHISYVTYKEIDRGLIELLGPLGLVRFFDFLKLKFFALQTSFLYNYLFLILVVFVIFFCHFFLIIDLELYFIFMVSCLYINKFKI